MISELASMTTAVLVLRTGPIAVDKLSPASSPDDDHVALSPMRLSAGVE